VSFRSQAREVEPGEVVVTEGEQGHQAFLVDKGELNVSVGKKQVDTVHAGAVFGELALIYNVPRTATITAASKVSLWVLHRTVFQRTLRAENISRRREIYATLKMAPMFKAMADRQLSRLADVAEIEAYEPGATIVKEGDVAQAMFILKAGQAVVSQDMPGGQEKKLIRIMQARRTPPLALPRPLPLPAPPPPATSYVLRAPPRPTPSANPRTRLLLAPSAAYHPPPCRAASTLASARC
jgi:CRP-like cAMP-binding protein